MKTRNGFVSNSSSTSFCVFGIRSDLFKIAEKITNFKSTPRKIDGCKHKFNRKKAKYCPECGFHAFGMVGIRPEEDEVSLACSKLGLTLVFGNSVDPPYWYLGVDLKRIEYKDISEIIEKMKEVEKVIKNKFDMKCQFHGGEYRNY